MSTYTFSALSFSYDANSNEYTSGPTFIQMEFVANAGVQFNYIVSDTPAGDLATFERFDGIEWGVYVDNFAEDLVEDEAQYSIGDITWSGGTTTVLRLKYPTVDGTEGRVYLPLAGTPLPEFSDLSDVENWENSISAFAPATGSFAPGQMIPWSSLPFDSLTENDHFWGTVEDDRYFGGKGRDTLVGYSGQDELFGGNGRDYLSGNSGKDLLAGQAGHDYLVGGYGYDELRGGKGRDTLRGGNGNDTLLGGKGTDHLNGDAGNDFLTGGKGTDTFMFTSNFGNDVITDFDAINENEVIDLSGVDAIISYSDLMDNHISQTGDDVLIQDGNGNAITLQGINLAELDQGDFIF